MNTSIFRAVWLTVLTSVGMLSGLAAQPAPVPADEGERAPTPPPTLPADVKLTPLNPGKTLFLEKMANGKRRVWVQAVVCLREGPLEVFLCKKNTKEHEAILSADIDARDLHMALIVCGAKPGSPVQFVPTYQPANGSKVDVSIAMNDKDGKLKQLSAREWIRNIRTKKDMDQLWVFAGSRFLKNPDDPKMPPYYTANNGEIISLSNFVDSMLDLPVKSSRETADLLFEAQTEKIPPLATTVYVILEPKE
ncbi:YdjY domain-containing protein [Tuwongella immobilis]|nr:YdjY domain-containing protein [Tuwongella immobilis]